MPFYTRPNFEDRQIVQYNGDTITLSGETNINNVHGSLIIKAPTLDFTGTTTASTQYTIAGVTGYINSGKASSFIVEPPIILVSGSTGTTTVNVTGYYLGGLNSGGTVTWLPAVSSGGGAFTGGTGTCITDLYVTNIHGCSPIHIQPTSSDDIIMAEGGGNVGIGVSPLYRFHVSGKTSNTELLYEDVTTAPSVGPNFRIVTNNDDDLTFLGVQDNTSNSSLILTFRGYNSSTFVNTAYGKKGDATLYASVNTNGLNIMNNNGSGKEDYIRFYAGTNASTDSPDMHIQGTGTTRGFIGMGTKNPQSKLDVSGKTRTTTLQVTSGATTGYVLTALDSDGNASWQPATGGGSGTTIIQQFTGNTSGDCITDLYVRNLHGCSPIYVHDILSGNSTNNFLDLSSYPSRTLLQTTAFGLDWYLGMGQSPYGGITLGNNGGTFLRLANNSGFVQASDFFSLNISNKYMKLQNNFGLELITVSSLGSNNGSLFFVKSNESAGGNVTPDGNLTGGTLQGEIILGKPLNATSNNLGLPIGVMGTGLGSETTSYGITGYDYFPVFISTPRSRAYDDVDYTSIKNVLFGGGSNNVVYTGVTNSALIGGSGNTINSYLKNTVVLAGEAITATTSNTVYVPDLVIKKSASVPTTSADTVGDIGSVTWDNSYLYVKTNIGWGKTPLNWQSNNNVMVTSGITTGITAVTLSIDVSYYGVNHIGDVDISLPNPTGYDGYNINIKDESGNASIYRIRLTPLSGLIDGTTYVDMNTNYMSLHIIARNNNWWII